MSTMTIAPINSNTPHDVNGTTETGDIVASEGGCCLSPPMARSAPPPFSRAARIS